MHSAFNNKKTEALKHTKRALRQGASALFVHTSPIKNCYGRQNITCSYKMSPGAGSSEKLAGNFTGAYISLYKLYL
jgi:hypothetical protein